MASKEIEGRTTRLFRCRSAPDVGVSAGERPPRALSLRSTSCFSSHSISLLQITNISGNTLQSSGELFSPRLAMKVSLSFSLTLLQQKLERYDNFAVLPVRRPSPLACLADSSANPSFVWCVQRFKPLASQLDGSIPKTRVTSMEDTHHQQMSQHVFA